VESPGGALQALAVAGGGVDFEQVAVEQFGFGGGFQAPSGGHCGCAVVPLGQAALCELVGSVLDRRDHFLDPGLVPVVSGGHGAGERPPAHQGQRTGERHIGLEAAAVVADPVELLELRPVAGDVRVQAVLVIRDAG
jgi:hypothetical protein